MNIWVPLKEGDGVVGHVNAAAAALAYDLGGAPVLSLIDVRHAVPIPHTAAGREAAAIHEIGQQNRD